MNSNTAPYQELWVYFDTPDRLPPSNAIVLSFMGAKTEHEFEKSMGTRFISGRLIAQKIRSQARKTYLDLVTQIPATPCVAGKTLRERLKGSNGISRWWYLRVSQKNSVGINDPYTPIIQLFCIKSVADEHNIKIIHILGSQKGFGDCLKIYCRVFVHKPHGLYLRIQEVIALFQGMAARLYFITHYLFLLWTLNKIPVPKNMKFDVALQGYWDWSVSPLLSGELKDKYFTDLPHLLKNKSIPFGWIARFSPRNFKWYKKQNRANMISELKYYPEVVFIEKFLRIRDILASAINLRYLFVWFEFSRSNMFKALFIRDELNFYPLLKLYFLRGFAGNEIPYNETFCIAAERFCASTKPKAILTFLELFLESRAIYAGAKKANSEVELYAAQHASYSSDKTFGFLDKDIELDGKPDHCPMPVPDKIFAMGKLSYDIWIKNGFAANQVILTGGLRYQHIRIRDSRRKGDKMKIMLLSGMNEILDFDMCEAVCSATEEMQGIELWLRDHPLYKISDLKGFEKFRSKINVTTNPSPEGDLLSSDLVLFTHSSLAEEAFLMGMPVWQWLWAGFNSSTFIDIPVIPVFLSIHELKESIEQFISKPESFYPSEEIKREVLKNFFSTSPENTSKIIFEEISRYSGLSR